MKQVLSFGAGVQSTAILLLIVDGRLPRPDLVVMADTGWEPAEVYRHADEMRYLAESIGLEFVTVRAGNIRDDHLRRADGYPTASGKSVPDHLRSLRSMPLFTLNEQGDKGMMKRQCTERYKIQPIQRHVRKVYGRKEIIVQWFGISTDEPERERLTIGRLYRPYYPLLHTIPMSRVECVEYLRTKGITAPKSACIGCPYRDRERWQAVRDDPQAWREAVEFDRAIRRMPDARSDLFLHANRVPLDQVDWSQQPGTQEEIWGMVQECAGMCGV